MNTKINILKNKLIIEEKMYFFACLLLVPFFFFEFNNISILNLCKIFGTISLIYLIFGLFTWYRKNNTLNSPEIYFVLASYLCWYGQVIVRCFGLMDNLIEIDLFDPSAFYKTLSFLTVSFNFMFLGMIISSKKRDLNINLKKSSIKDINLKKSMTFVAIIMVIVGGVAHYYDIFTNLYQSLKFGYASLYESVDNSAVYNILMNIKMFFWPGLIILCFANKDNKNLFNIIVCVAIVDVILCFLTGARSDALMIIITFFWILTSEFKTISLKQIILLILLFLVLIKLIVIVYDFRILPEKNFLSVLNLIFHPKTNMFSHVLREFGFNIFSLHHTMLLVPTVDSFGYGYTYFASIMAMIPSLLMGGYSFSDKAALPNWLMTRLNMDYGPGYTIVAESFYNFGYFGFLMMFIIGTLFGFAFNNKYKGDKRIIKSTIVAILLYSNIFIVRDTFLLVFRKLLYVVIIPFLIIYIIKIILDKKFELKLYKILYRLVEMIQSGIDKLKSTSIRNNSKSVLITIPNEKYIDFVSTHIELLKEFGYDVDVVLNGKCEVIEDLNGIILLDNDFSFWKRIIKNQIFLKRLIKQNNYSIIESYGFDSWYTTRLCLACHPKYNSQTFYINLDDDFNQKSYFHKLIISFIDKILSLFTNVVFIQNENYYNYINDKIYCDIEFFSEDFISKIINR